MDKLSKLYDSVFEKESLKITYGTAGFRMKKEKLPKIFCVVGILSILYGTSQNNQNKQKKEPKTVGIMITASHNIWTDNGVKIVNPEGEMMEPKWEQYAVKLANSENGLNLIKNVKEIMKIEKIEEQDFETNIKIFIGHDTRPSSIELISIMKKVFQYFKLEKDKHFYEYGLLTTPQLHYLVYYDNFKSKNPSEDVYYHKLTQNFQKFLSYLPSPSSFKKKRILVDCSFGVGGYKFDELFNQKNKYLNNHFECNLINLPMKDNKNYKDLNVGCGAEYVQKKQTFPKNFVEKIKNEKTKFYDSYASIDGDSDRLVYFGNLNENKNEENKENKEPEFVLIDGDRIAVLYGILLNKLLKKIGLDKKLSIGIVQTAYANGSSTKYLKKIMGENNVYCVATGVKHLCKKAKSFDIGLYFEANGHGTIHFTKKAIDLIEKMSIEEKEGNEAKLLYYFMKITNRQVGDAISDLILVESALLYLQIDWKKWIKLYEDLPSITTKVPVKDRSIFVVNEDETKVLKPEGFQNIIDSKCLTQFEKSDQMRTFVRPSGTENVVRVYSEGITKEKVQKLSKIVCEKVSQIKF